MATPFQADKQDTWQSRQATHRGGCGSPLKKPYTEQTNSKQGLVTPNGVMSHTQKMSAEKKTLLAATHPKVIDLAALQQKKN